MRNFTLLFISMIIAQLISSCGTSIDSTSGRYKHEEETKIQRIEESASPLIEDFNFSPYFLKIPDEKPKQTASSSNKDELWWNYPKVDASLKVTVRQPGFRVQVLATDDLDEAQQMRSDIYFKTNKNDIYISFQAPLYKVKVGDYATPSDANNLAFKLNQLGFSPTQVVADTVNLLQNALPNKK
ncbi:MAG: SPOR domain-containing protein [Ignavibacteria bacterium]|nr:SPOR domain-containing protein [Ignavibacteria bacterium]